MALSTSVPGLEVQVHPTTSAVLAWWPAVNTPQALRKCPSLSPVSFISFYLGPVPVSPSREEAGRGAEAGGSECLSRVPRVDGGVTQEVGSGASVFPSPHWR